LARFIALDLDQRQLHVLSVSTGRGGSRFEQVLSHAFPEDLTPSSGESLGKALRDALKQLGVQPAPMIACVGRDRVILKEVRFPGVPKNEEAALVRFQASKELTEAPSEVVIDYLLLSEAGVPGPRLAMAMVVRRDLIQAMNAVARAIGVKLVGVLPRPVAMAAALDRAKASNPGESAAVVNLNDRWAEFCVIRDGKPRFSRSLLTTATLMQDVKRSLMLYAAQEGEEELPQVLYLGGRPTPDVCEAWRSAVGLKVQGLDPFEQGDKTPPDAERGAYLAATGLGHLAASFPNWSVNFARPKESGPARSESRRKNMVLSGIGIGLVALLFLAGFVYVLMRRGEVDALRAQEQDLEVKIKDYGQDKPTVNALREWDAGTVSWLDELYDIGATFPHVKGVRINQVNATTLVRKGPADKYSGRIMVHGFVPRDKTNLVNEFVQTMMATPRGLQSKIPGKKAEQSVLVAVQNTKPAADGSQEFQLKIDVAKHMPPEFQALLPTPKTSPTVSTKGSTKGSSKGARTFTKPAAKSAPAEETEE